MENFVAIVASIFTKSRTSVQVTMVVTHNFLYVSLLSGVDSGTIQKNFKFTFTEYENDIFII